jgi:predicted phage terminase large subunit-like protein
MRFTCYDGKNEDTRPDVRDHRTREGELLWPALWPEEKVRQEERDLGPYGASAQLQQTPIPEGGGLFKREYFEIVDAIPTGCIEVRAWDTADTQGGGHWTVGGKMAYHPPTRKFYVSHVVRDQLESGKVNDLIISTAKVDGRKVRIAEGSGSGKAVTAARAKSLLGYDYKVMPEVSTEDKVTRAGAFRAQAESHNIYMVRGEWNEVVLDVLAHFPVGKFDDDVDALAHAFNRLVQLIGGGQGVVIKGRERR